MSEFDDYAGLFAEDGDVDIPSNFTLGAAYKLTPRATVAFDVQHIRYSEVAAIGNKMQPALSNCNFTAGDLDYCLGGDHGMGFGWDDQTIYKIGLQQQYSNDLTLRAGFSLTDMPFKKSETLFNVLSPATIEKHFTAGFTKRLSKDTELSMTAMYAPEGRISGAPLGQPVTIRMHQFELEASYGMSW
jgi:long-chain fatty acid transport protein